MLVREVMTTDVAVATPQTSLRSAARLLDARAVTSLPVVDADGRLVGVLSEADVLRDALPADPRAHEIPPAMPHAPAYTLVDEVMSRHPVTVRPDTDLADAVGLLTSSAVKSLPVVDGNYVVGVISRRDALALLARRDTAIGLELADLLGGVADDWSIHVVDGVVVVEGPTTEQDRALVTTAAAVVPGVVGVELR